MGIRTKGKKMAFPLLNIKSRGDTLEVEPTWIGKLFSILYPPAELREYISSSSPTAANHIRFMEGKSEIYTTLRVERVYKILNSMGFKPTDVEYTTKDGKWYYGLTEIVASTLNIPLGDFQEQLNNWSSPNSRIIPESNSFKHSNGQEVTLENLVSGHRLQQNIEAIGLVKELLDAGFSLGFFGNQWINPALTPETKIISTYDPNQKSDTAFLTGSLYKQIVSESGCTLGKRQHPKKRTYFNEIQIEGLPVLVGIIKGIADGSGNPASYHFVQWALTYGPAVLYGSGYFIYSGLKALNDGIDTCDMHSKGSTRSTTSRKFIGTTAPALALAPISAAYGAGKAVVHQGAAYLISWGLAYGITSAFRVAKKMMM